MEGGVYIFTYLLSAPGSSSQIGQFKCDFKYIYIHIAAQFYGTLTQEAILNVISIPCVSLHWLN